VKSFPAPGSIVDRKRTRRTKVLTEENLYGTGVRCGDVTKKIIGLTRVAKEIESSAQIAQKSPIYVHMR
jgi:hypothetical protein